MSLPEHVYNAFEKAVTPVRADEAECGSFDHEGYTYDIDRVSAQIRITAPNEEAEYAFRDLFEMENQVGTKTGFMTSLREDTDEVVLRIERPVILSELVMLRPKTNQA